MIILSQLANIIMLCGGRAIFIPKNRKEKDNNESVYITAHERADRRSYIESKK